MSFLRLSIAVLVVIAAGYQAYAFDAVDAVVPESDLLRDPKPTFVGQYPQLLQAKTSGGICAPLAEAAIAALKAAQECTEAPTMAPTDAPTESPTGTPTDAPTEAPTNTPTILPTFPPVPPGRGASRACRGFVIPQSQLDSGNIRTCQLKTTFALTNILTGSYWSTAGKTYKLGPCTGTSSPNYCHFADGVASSDVDVCTNCVPDSRITSIDDCAALCEKYSGERSDVAWVAKSPAPWCPNMCGQSEATVNQYVCKYTDPSLARAAALADSACDHVARPSSFSSTCPATPACEPAPARGSSDKCAGFSIPDTQVQSGSVTTCQLKTQYALTRMLTGASFPSRTYSIGACTDGKSPGGSDYCFHADGIASSDVDVSCAHLPGGRCPRVSSIDECAALCRQLAPPPPVAPAPAPGGAGCTADTPCSGLYSFAASESDVPSGAMWINTRSGELGNDVWKLVRRVKGGGTTWHPATDRMAGTDVYGNYDGWIGSDNTFSIKFDDMNCDQYLFTNLVQHGSIWWVDYHMTMTKDVLMRTHDGETYDAPFLRSNNCVPPRTCNARIKRTDDISTPWIADDIKHQGGPTGGAVSYAENGAQLPYQPSVARGYNVYCRVQT